MSNNFPAMSVLFDLFSSDKDRVDERDMSSKKIKRSRCEVWTRVMGYHRPVSFFNLGKKSEHYGRKHFRERDSSASFSKKYLKIKSDLC